MKTLRVGPGNAEGVTIGPLIDARATAKVRQNVADAVAQGAVLHPANLSHPAGNRFLQPGMLTDVTPGMRVLHEETFGPLAPVVKFADEAEAIASANDTDAGLAAYVYTRDQARGWRVVEALGVGMVGMNCGAISTELAPFGGIKSSGLGREGSRHGLDEYLQLKYVCLSLTSAI